MRRSIGLFILALVCWASTAPADTLYVDEAGNTPYLEIQDAVDAAVDGDLPSWRGELTESRVIGPIRSRWRPKSAT